MSNNGISLSLRSEFEPSSEHLSVLSVLQASTSSADSLATVTASSLSDTTESITTITTTDSSETTESTSCSCTKYILIDGIPLEINACGRSGLFFGVYLSSDTTFSTNYILPVMRWGRNTNKQPLNSAGLSFIYKAVNYHINNVAGVLGCVNSNGVVGTVTSGGAVSCPAGW